MGCVHDNSSARGLFTFLHYEKRASKDRYVARLRRHLPFLVDFFWGQGRLRVTTGWEVLWTMIYVALQPIGCLIVPRFNKENTP